MHVFARCSVFVVLVTSAAMTAEPARRAEFYPSVLSYLELRTGEFEQIPPERKAQLERIALYVKSRSKASQPARLTFICTHNSRRSQMSQIWAAAAASYYGVSGVETYSGGTEATAFNARAVAAIERAGLKVQKIEAGTNPHYAVRFRDTDRPLVCFSKVYRDAPNPQEDFCAVMTCAQADKNCPIVRGCSLRVGLPFEDPKVADDKPEEAATYDARCQQICREMLYLFSQVGNSGTTPPRCMVPAESSRVLWPSPLVCLILANVFIDLRAVLPIIVPGCVEIIGREALDALQELLIARTEPARIHQAPDRDPRVADAGASAAHAGRFLNPARLHIRGHGMSLLGPNYSLAPGSRVKLYASTSVSTWPCTSVRRRSMPLWRTVRRVWSMPSRCRIVAWMS